MAFSANSQNCPPIYLNGGEIGTYNGNNNCIDSATIAYVTKRVNENLDALGSKTNTYSNKDQDDLLDWPLKLAPGQQANIYYVIGTNFDIKINNPLAEDYECNSRTYNSHNGTDIGLWPFGWNKMDAGAVEIIASADGILVDKNDGDYDRNCGASSTTGNYVILLHSNGSKTYYWHMKNSSVTNKPIGSNFIRGEYLGKVGSSGNSSGPHLHFAVQLSNGTFVDPAFGNCNPIQSLWLNQKPYIDSKIHEVATHKHNNGPVFPPCPENEQTNISTTFDDGELVDFSSYFSDQQNNQSVLHKIIKPDNSIHIQWTQNFTDNYSVSYWVSSWYLPNSAPIGIWRYEASFQGITASTNFSVGISKLSDDPLSINAAFYVTPNPTSNYLNIFNLETKVPLKIFNVLGQNVTSEVNFISDAELDVSNLLLGTYVISNGCKNAIWIKI